MKIIETREETMVDTHEVRIYFTGYVTHEWIQDCIHNGFGASYEEFAYHFMRELSAAPKTGVEE